MTTFTFPRVVVPLGSTDLGPANAADSERGLVLTIDRTVAGGLNSLTGASALAITIWQSDDGGTVFYELGGGGFAGGPLLNKQGGTRLTESLSTQLNPGGTGRKLKMTVTAAGTPIAVAGTLATT
jgi:hypothetical protein